MVGGSNAHFTGNFWRLRPSDFNEASVLGGVPGTGLADWPITYDGARAVLHEGRVGARRLGRAGAVRSAAVAAVSDAAAAGEVVRRAVRARRAGARPAPAAGADGDQLAALQRPAGLPALRLLPVLHVRVRREVDVDGDDAAARRGDGPLRDPAGELRGARRDRRDGRATGVAYFDAQKRLQLQRAKAVVLCANGAETPRLLLNSESSRFPNGLANSSGVVGKHLMFNTYFGVNAQFEQPLNEYKSVQNTRMVLDFYDTDPKRGFYGGGGIDARFGKYPIIFALGGLPPGSPTWGEGFARGLAEQFTRTMFFGTHGTSLPLETNSVTHRPVAQGRLGPAVHARHLPGSPRRPEVRGVPRRAGDARSRRRPARSRRGPSR